MSVSQQAHDASVASQAMDRLYETILQDIKPYLKGTGRERSVAVGDAKKLLGLAVSCKGSAMAFDTKARAELGLSAGGKSFVPLQGQILQRLQDQANTAKLQSSISTFKGGVREQLTGGISKGGLIRVAPSDRPVFKKPDARPSGLGLQALAEKKRQEEGVTLLKRNRMSFEGQEDGAGDGDDMAPSLSGAAGGGKRQYRTKAPDTPSVGSGVDRDAQERIAERERERRGGGIAASTSGGGPREGDRERERDRGGDRERERDRERGARGRDSERSSASTWESSTPRRSAAPSVSSTPQRTSVDQWDIVASGARGGDRGASLSRGGREDERWRAVQGDRPRDRQLTKEEEAEMEERERALDRDWYDNDEGGTFLDETGAYDPFESMGGDDGGVNAPKKQVMKRMSAKKAAHLADDDRWIENQLLNSGVVTASRAAEQEDETEGRVHLMVRDIRPPFLDGKTVHTKKQDAVATVRDPTGDLATIARKGCASVRAYREKRDLNKSRQKFWEVEGSKIGGLMGVKEAEKEKTAEEEEVGEDGEVDYRKKNQFKNLMTEKNEAVSDFAKNKTLKQQREALPIYGCRAGMLRVVRDNQVVVIVGETGSGKTTQMAQYLHEEGYTTYGRIAITQPRRVAAMSVAKRVSEEFGCDLGTQVGYAIRFEDCTDESTLLKFMTDGILLRETLAESDLDQYSCVIMDEAHERSLNTDVLFGILRKVVSRRRDLKLIVTSATMDSQKFSDFFGGVPVFHIPGRTFPVEILHAKNPVEDYVEATVKQVLNIHLQYPKGDILAFMTGQEDIDAVCFMLRERLDELDDKGNVAPCDILPIHSMLPSEIQAKIFKAVSTDTRKVVVATNIAETSLTIDGIKYVIDCGFYKLKVFNPRMGMDSLQVTPESQANARQRQGRAGRTGPGIAWRLFTEAAFNFEMLHNTIPEIQRTNLGNVVLLLKSLGVNDLLEFDFMDPPPQDNILNSMYQLWILGALGNTGELTAMGKKMVEFPLDPPLSKMLIQAEELRCNQEVLTIVASLSVGGLGHIFYRPKERAEESDAAREKFAVPESDHLTMLHVYNQWKHNNFRGDWASEHFLQPKSLHKVREIRTQLQDICASQKMSLVSCSADWDKVRQAVCSAYFTNAARMKGVGEYENLRTAMKCYLHPTSSLYGIGFTPDYVVYHELVMTSKEYMQCVSVVDPHWLAEQGPMFFQVKETNYAARMASKRRGEEAVKQMERDLERQREEMAREKEREAALSMPRRPNTIVTPGFRDQGSATPRRTPARLGL